MFGKIGEELWTKDQKRATVVHQLSKPLMANFVNVKQVHGIYQSQPSERFILEQLHPPLWRKRHTEQNHEGYPFICASSVETAEEVSEHRLWDLLCLPQEQHDRCLASRLTSPMHKSAIGINKFLLFHTLPVLTLFSITCCAIQAMSYTTFLSSRTHHQLLSSPPSNHDHVAKVLRPQQGCAGLRHALVQKVLCLLHGGLVIANILP
mmetsp:Transcript_281/g.946  ORF Transcript_281/g.946 Transcript_281/m.946 type:complete len:207 (-) Transcript_281:267-887(-)